jgi:hypothetical protein
MSDNAVARGRARRLWLAALDTDPDSRRHAIAAVVCGLTTPADFVDTLVTVLLDGASYVGSIGERENWAQELTDQLAREWPETPPQDRYDDDGESPFESVSLLAAVDDGVSDAIRQLKASPKTTGEVAKRIVAGLASTMGEQPPVVVDSMVGLALSTATALNRLAAQ